MTCVKQQASGEWSPSRRVVACWEEPSSPQRPPDSSFLSTSVKRRAFRLWTIAYPALDKNMHIPYTITFLRYYLTGYVMDVQHALREVHPTQLAPIGESVCITVADSMPSANGPSYPPFDFHRLWAVGDGKPTIYLSPSPWVTILSPQSRFICIQTHSLFSPGHLTGDTPSCKDSQFISFSTTATASRLAIRPLSTPRPPPKVIDCLNPQLSFFSPCVSIVHIGHMHQISYPFLW
jgi:hypothetical protein